MTEERVHRVELLTRVEGEGRFTLRTRDGVVVDAQLAIFEAPRFFEAFLVGRSPQEALDIVARVCGICPVAYQVSASIAFERAFGVELTEPVRRLRRLLYCGEWVESHALHVFLLHAPDFLGYPSAVEMAADHRELVERGLRIKKAGDTLITKLGGRATHPVSPRVGGFHRAPRRRDVVSLREDVARALDESVETARWAASLDAPDFVQDYVFVALQDGEAYPLEGGDRVAVSGEPDVPLDAWDQAISETQVPYSTALHARLGDGRPYLTGPMARLHHHADKLHPTARRVMVEVGLGRSERNPFRSIVVRAVELVHALAEALDLIDAYREPDPPYVTAPDRTAAGSCGASEAPRGLLWHRFAVGDDGLITAARLIPPTSQNQARIEEDLRGLGEHLLAMQHDAATALCERLIRNYDPCISCATHFLDLRIEPAADAAPGSTRAEE
ncbi:MAG: Ni/Fe hydrogenase subunit alpha [Sandaracinaceae bacterium]